MCLGIPGKIIAIYEKDGLRMGQIDFGGVIREACLDFTPEAKVDDYALIHVGFAISLTNAAEAAETLALIRQISNLDEELNLPTSEVTAP